MDNNRLGDYPCMTELKDEDRWLKFFTKKQLLYIGVAALLGIGEIVLFYKIGLTVVGVELLLINIAVSFVIQQKLPPDKYLWGGGTLIEELLFRVVKKNLPGRKILYTKFINDEEDE